MGNEATVRAKVKGVTDEGRALLEAHELIFRGDVTCVVKLDDVRATASAGGGWLHLGDLSLQLGPAAQRWLEKIKNPKSILDKLGVKPGQHAVVIGLPEFARELEAKGLTTSATVKKNEALIFYKVGDLEQVKPLRKALADDGVLWLVRVKGKHAPVSESQTMAAGKAAGLVDVKVVSFSDTLSAEKYVVPLARRK